MDDTEQLFPPPDSRQQFEIWLRDEVEKLVQKVKTVSPNLSDFDVRNSD